MSKDKDKSTWGGKRPGAGRPTTGDSKRVRLHVVVDSKTRNAITRTAKAAKKSQGQVIDDLARPLTDESGEVPPKS